MVFFQFILFWAILLTFSNNFKATCKPMPPTMGFKPPITALCTQLALWGHDLCLPFIFSTSLLYTCTQPLMVFKLTGGLDRSRTQNLLIQCQVKSTYLTPNKSLLCTTYKIMAKNRLIEVSKSYFSNLLHKCINNFKSIQKQSLLLLEVCLFVAVFFLIHFNVL